MDRIVSLYADNKKTMMNQLVMAVLFYHSKFKLMSRENLKSKNLVQKILMKSRSGDKEETPG